MTIVIETKKRFLHHVIGTVDLAKEPVDVVRQRVLEPTYQHRERIFLTPLEALYQLFIGEWKQIL